MADSLGWWKAHRPGFCAAALAFVVGCAAAAFGQQGGALTWTHLSSEKGDLPAPGKSNQQTAALTFDADKNGVDDFVVCCRQAPPSVILYRREGSAWKRYVVDPDTLPIEAGAAASDIDGDGDLDLVAGADASGNKLWWWENPYPQFDPDRRWKRREIKNTGPNKHHHQIFGDFDGDGKDELVFWNQKARTLYLADIPADPRNTEPWPLTAIYKYTDREHEGLAKVDIDGDGKLDIVGGGNWYKHEGGKEYTAHAIDKTQRFARAAAGQLKKGGWGEAVFSPGDAVGRLKWYEWDGSKWIGHDLLGQDIVHGHSLEVADFNTDGNLDIFCAEMHTPGHKGEAAIYIFLGDGKGNFTKTEIAEGKGIGNHESQVGDLDGDGDIDIVNKPYTAGAPRIDVWLNGGTAASK